MQKVLRIKLTKTYWFAILISLGVLYFNATVRTTISQTEVMAVNWLVYVAFIFFNNEKHKSNILRFSKNRYISLIITITLFIMLLFSMYSNALVSIRFIISIGIPIFIMFVQIKSNQGIEMIIRIWTSTLNTAMLIVFICGVIDVVSGYILTDFFSSLYHTEAILQMRIDEPSRIITFLGHPLFASEIALISCIFNCFDMKYFHYQRYLLVKMGIALGVAALSGSKTVFLLILILILYSNFSNKKIRNIVTMVIMIYLLYMIGIFDTIIERFIVGIQTGDLTTGRNVRLLELLQARKLQFEWFKGHNQILGERFIIALEYPILRLSYRYGIFYTMCLYAVIIVYPLVNLLIKKQYSLLICLAALIVDVNTYSGLASTGDGMLVYMIVVFLILNLSRYLQRAGSGSKN